MPTTETQRTKRKHLLLTAEIRKRLPKIGATDSQGEQAIAQVKFFSPFSGWTWYITEFDGEDEMFGLVVGFETELGYISFNELETVMFQNVCPAVERDCHWEPRTLEECRKAHPSR